MDGLAKKSQMSAVVFLEKAPVPHSIAVTDRLHVSTRSDRSVVAPLQLCRATGCGEKMSAGAKSLVSNREKRMSRQKHRLKSLKLFDQFWLLGKDLLLWILA